MLAGSQVALGGLVARAAQIPATFCVRPRPTIARDWCARCCISASSSCRSLCRRGSPQRGAVLAGALGEGAQPGQLFGYNCVCLCATPRVDWRLTYSLIELGWRFGCVKDNTAPYRLQDTGLRCIIKCITVSKSSAGAASRRRQRILMRNALAALKALVWRTWAAAAGL